MAWALAETWAGRSSQALKNAICLKQTFMTHLTSPTGFRFTPDATTISNLKGRINQDIISVVQLMNSISDQLYDCMLLFHHFIESMYHSHQSQIIEGRRGEMWKRCYSLTITIGPQAVILINRREISQIFWWHMKACSNCGTTLSTMNQEQITAI